MNDDGYSDVIISAHGANEAYVFYGAASYSSDAYSLNTLSGIDGFIISTGNDGDEIVVAGVGVREAGRHQTGTARNEPIANIIATTLATFNC